MKKLLSIIGIALCGVLISAQEIAKSQKDNESQTAKTLISLSLLRELGTRDCFTEQLSKELEKKWFNEFKDFYADGHSPFFQDFFRNSLLLIGPGNKESNIVAIYDPWSDNILVLQMKNMQSSNLVQNYCFLPGAIFRQEKINKDFVPQSVLPSKESLEIALLNATAKTRKQFMTLFPMDMKEISLSALPQATAETSSIIKRSMAIRFNSAINILESNKDLFPKIVLCNKMIREFSQNELARFFEDSAGERKMISVLTSQSEEIRKSYKITYVVQGKDADTFAYVNRNIPTMVICIVVSKDKIKFFLSVLDLGYSSELLQKLSSFNAKGGER